MILVYSDYSKEFEILNDALSKQTDVVIIQCNKPIAFFSRKLTDMQQRYSVTKIEQVATVETLKELKCMLWGQRLKIFTNDKNLIQDALGLTSDRVYQWRLLSEDLEAKIVHI